MYNNSNKQILLPIWLALAIGAGILIGAQFVGKPITTKKAGNAIEKMLEVLLSIENNYVDSIDVSFLVEEGIKGMLKELDPHTSYIPSKELKSVQAQLKGSYDGIGIEFDVLNDTIVVVKPTQGGPSEEAGIQIGDRIIAVNGEPVAGINITTKGVSTRLLGDKGSEVEVLIYRPNVQKEFSVTIKRGSISQSTVDAFYMVDEYTGYLKLSRFGSSSAKEINQVLTKLINQGMNQLIFDLQGNAGGYLDEAKKIADEFIKENKIIISQKGKEGKFNEVFKSSNKGIFEQNPIIVLIDEYSASASEILAGALQDNDRGLIVGRRSFGKGLVQLPIGLSDGSELRLTIARYYTPSGRSIQKSYAHGNKEYGHDITDRFTHGEFYYADSIHFPDSLKYTTLSGRTVYGGGGIMPDYFVPLDTTSTSSFYVQLFNKRVLRAWVLAYYSKNKEQMNEAVLANFVASFKWNSAYKQSLKRLSTQMGVSFNEAEYQIAKPQIIAYCKAEIVRLRWGRNEYYKLINPVNNHAFKKSLNLFDQAILLNKKG